MNEHALPTDPKDLTMRRVMSTGAQLYHRAQGPMVVIAGTFAFVEAVLGLLMYYGLYGSVVRVDAFTPAALLLSLLPGQDLRVGVSQPFTGPLGSAAGFFGILAGVVNLLSAFAILRAVSLTFHGHRVTFLEGARTSLRRLPTALAILVRQLYAVLLWPLVILVVLLSSTAGIRMLHVGGALERVLAVVPPALWFIGGAVALAIIIDRLILVFFAWPAMIDQGLSSRAAMQEAERLARGLRSFLLWGGLLLLACGIGIESVFYIMLGSGVGLFGLSPDSAAVLFDILLVCADALILPLVACWTFVLYRSVLSVKGGAKRSE